MFDIVEGFQSRGVKEVTLKHAKKFVVTLVSIISIFIAVRFIFAKESVFPLGGEFYGAIGGLTIVLIAEYLKSIIKLRDTIKEN